MLRTQFYIHLSPGIFMGEEIVCREISLIFVDIFIEWYYLWTEFGNNNFLRIISDDLRDFAARQHKRPQCVYV